MRPGGKNVALDTVKVKYSRVIRFLQGESQDGLVRNRYRIFTVQPYIGNDL